MTKDKSTVKPRENSYTLVIIVSCVIAVMMRRDDRVDITRAELEALFDLGYLDRLLELGVAARGGVAVRAPAHELRRVAEARALHVVVADLDHALRPQRDERE